MIDDSKSLDEIKLTMNEDYLHFISASKNGSLTSDSVPNLETSRPWGVYRHIDVGNRYQVKRITVAPSGCLSLQKHHHRSEHWVVVARTAEITIIDLSRSLVEGESVYIPNGAVHRLANTGILPTVLIEVQIGPYTGEDDIVRIDDTYGRV